MIRLKELKKGDRVIGYNSSGKKEYSGKVIHLKKGLGKDRGGVERDDGVRGSGPKIPGYGNSWQIIFNKGKNRWGSSADSGHIEFEKITNWKERLQ